MVQISFSFQSELTLSNYDSRIGNIILTGVYVLYLDWAEGFDYITVASFEEVIINFYESKVHLHGILLHL